MIRYRNSPDETIRRLERSYLSDPTDLTAYRAYLAAMVRAGMSLDKAVAPADVEAYAVLLEFRILSGVTTRPRVVMAARLGHAAAQLVAPEWDRMGPIRLINNEYNYEAIVALGDKREAMFFMCDCAERVLPIVERNVPIDVRPRLAIEAIRTWLVSPSRKTEDAACAARYLSVNGGSAELACGRAISSSARAVYVINDVYVCHVSHVCYDVANAVANAVNDVHDAQAFVAERLRQERRLAQYLVGDVTLPPLPAKKTSRKRTAKP